MTEEADGFQIEEGFQIELIAKEPLIADPVDMVIDEWGRLYVVEMHGYPLDLSGSGLIKRLRDSNGDGLPDESMVFADSLIVPTGIMRWKKGFIVTDPPHVYYFEDTDDDGRADVREILLTGFARSNPQHNVNNPTYGLDNWIYLCHEGAVRTQQFGNILGDKGSAVHMPQMPDAKKLPQNANGLSVRFRPDSKQLELISSRSQFGQAFDKWGHHFQTNNAAHLYHKVIAAPYLQRNPDLLIPSSQFFIPKGGRGFDIFPITANPSHQLLTDIGALTSACGIMSYNADLFPQMYDQSIFAAEPVHNIIHVDRIEDRGATYHSIPLLEGREFLASTDAWFRPVNHYLAPDGSIFVLDYYRKIIEHPEWLSDEVIQSGDLYLGKDQGRIYRISPQGTPSMTFLDRLTLGDGDIDDLVSGLADPNIWWRRHAQRLLMDKNDPSIVDALKKFVATTRHSIGKAHAMWLIESKGAMDENILLDMLDNEEAGLRENAIKIAESYLSTGSKLHHKLLSLIDDKHPKVRFQLLLTLGNLFDPKTAMARTHLLIQDIEDPWVHDAALSASHLNVTALFNAVIPHLNQQTEGVLGFVKKLSQLIVRSGGTQALNRFLVEAQKSTTPDWLLPIILEGMANGADGKKDFALSTQNTRFLAGNFNVVADPALRQKSLVLLRAAEFFKAANNPLLEQAIQITEQPQSEELLLADAIQILGWSGSMQNFELLENIFAANTSSTIRSVTLQAMDEISSELFSDFIVSKWPGLSPEGRKRGVQILLGSDQKRLVLMRAIAENKIQPSILSWGQTVSLLNHRNQEIRRLARTHLQGNELNANTVWNSFEESLRISGKMDQGREVFKKHCGICHQKAGNDGIAFGPDLAGVQNRTKAALLLDILQPNKSIADGFELWTLSMVSGRDLAGIISQQTAQTLTITDATGLETTVDRSDIKELTASEWSAMPENIHVQISQQEMAHLLAFLKTK